MMEKVEEFLACLSLTFIILYKIQNSEQVSQIFS